MPGNNDNSRDAAWFKSIVTDSTGLESFMLGIRLIAPSDTKMILNSETTRMLTTKIWTRREFNGGSTCLVFPVMLRSLKLILILQTTAPRLLSYRNE